MKWQQLTSGEDRSVNFVSEWKSGILECRYVRRTDDYFIVYLSSHSGCKHACRFCHLTATGQTSFDEVGFEEFSRQADKVLDYYDSVKEIQGHASTVHFNWMARGEPLSNRFLQENSRLLTNYLASAAESRGLASKFKFSTIMPLDMGDHSLEDYFQNQPVDIYYSLYSLDQVWRKRWLPKAIAPEQALDRLKNWQVSTGRGVTLHWPFIRDENDSEQMVEQICDLVEHKGLKAKFNLVRYNPWSASKGEESSEAVLNRNFKIIQSRFGGEKSRIVPRVGFDVQASCGMFVEE